MRQNTSSSFSFSACPQMLLHNTKISPVWRSSTDADCGASSSAFSGVALTCSYTRVDKYLSTLFESVVCLYIKFCRVLMIGKPSLAKGSKCRWFKSAVAFFTPACSIMSILVLFPLRAQFPWYDVCSEAQTHLGLWVCTFCQCNELSRKHERLLTQNDVHNHRYKSA